MNGELRSVGLNGGPTVREVTIVDGGFNQALKSVLKPQLVLLLQTMTPVDFGVGINVTDPFVVNDNQVIPPVRAQVSSGSFQPVITTITIWSATRQVVLTFPNYVTLGQLRGVLIDVARELAR